MKPGGHGHVSKSGASLGPLTHPSQLKMTMMKIKVNSKQGMDGSLLFVPATLDKDIALGSEMSEPGTLWIFPADPLKMTRCVNFLGRTLPGTLEGCLCVCRSR